MNIFRMRRRHLLAGRHHQRGMNLVELMVAMTLGLVLVGGAGQIFLSNTQAFRLQDSVSNLQQSGRLVMEMVLADIRRAGLDMQSSAFPTAGISGRNGSATVAANAGLLQASDEVIVAYVAPEAMTDCEGRTANPGDTIVNRYFVRMDSNPNIPALFCAGRVNNQPLVASSGTPLLRGVESLQFIFGFAPNTGNGVASPAFYASAPAGGVTNQLVAAVQMAMVVRTEVGIQGVAAPNAAIEPFGGNGINGATPISQAQLAAVTVNGQFPVHRVFSGIAAIRNPAFATFPPP